MLQFIVSPLARPGAGWAIHETRHAERPQDPAALNKPLPTA